MPHIFLSSDARLRNSWRQAFPSLRVGRLDGVPGVPGLIWALLPSGTTADELVRGLRRELAGRALIVLADEPDEEGALAALAAGAAAYCNGHAAPEVLVQVATVVENGGLWIGEGLMKRLLTASAGLLQKRQGGNQAWRQQLTPREQEVALAVGEGATNKEIARRLEITERTVKFHVSALLEKLGVRDRLQLSLLINGVDSME